MVVTKRAVSSGGVIYKIEDGEIFICLIERTDREVWGLPKGAIAEGETPEETALREVKEETGLEGEVIKKVGEVDYWFYWKPDKARYHKTVHFFLMKYVSGDTASHDWEVKTAQWFPVEEAIVRMSYKNEIEMVKKAKKRLASG